MSTDYRLSTVFLILINLHTANIIPPRVQLYIHDYLINAIGEVILSLSP